MMPPTNRAVTVTIGRERIPIRYRLRVSSSRSIWPPKLRRTMRQSSTPSAPTTATMSDRLPNSTESESEGSSGSDCTATPGRLQLGALTAKRGVRYRMRLQMAFDSRKIALQLWTLREHLKTADDVARSFARVREIGYEHVQLSGLGPIPAADVK